MSAPVHIKSKEQFNNLLTSSTFVVADFHAQWCGPCHAIAPVYEQLSSQLSRPNRITFTKIDVDERQDIAQAYGVRAMPTFIVFERGRVTNTIQGADASKLSQVIRKLAAEAGKSEPASSKIESEFADGPWVGTATPKGYSDITEEYDVKGVELLNRDSEFGTVRTIFESSKPSALGNGKGKDSPDWVESDTDEQLMLFIPFKSTLKVHSLHITSLPPTEGEDDDDEVPMRPKTIHLYTNRAHVLGFDEAEDIPPVQKVTIESGEWDPKTGTAKIDLRFVKFQTVFSLNVFFVDGDGDSEKIRVDRIRIFGEAGEKREMGKLEKIGDEQGE
ncbi:PITH domain-containing protein [Aspergillus crustosus]